MISANEHPKKTVEVLGKQMAYVDGEKNLYNSFKHKANSHGTRACYVVGKHERASFNTKLASVRIFDN